MPSIMAVEQIGAFSSAFGWVDCKTRDTQPLPNKFLPCTSRLSMERSIKVDVSTRVSPWSTSLRQWIILAPVCLAMNAESWNVEEVSR